MFLGLELHVPLCSVYHAVVGQEGQFAVSTFFSVRQDVAGIFRSEPVLFLIVSFTINFYVLLPVSLLFRISRRAVIKSKTDGVQNRRLAAAGRTYDAEYGAFL